MIGAGAVLAPGLHAQDTSATGTVAGRLVDVTTNLPILRGWICESYPPTRVPAVGNCGQTDTLGRFSVSKLRVGPRDLWVTCNRKSRRFDSPAMERVVLHADVRREDTDLGSVVVDGTHCDQRPLIHRVGEFVGYYSGGFESSRFRWSADSTLGIWVTGPWEAVHRSSIQWPRSTQENPQPCVLVRWHGTLVGPGQYGHLGGADYLFTFDRVAEVSEAPRAACSG
jgi:hypothetical protein